MWPGEADKVNARGNWDLYPTPIPLRGRWPAAQLQRAAQSLQRPDSEFRLHGFGMRRIQNGVYRRPLLSGVLQRLLLLVGRV